MSSHGQRIEGLESELKAVMTRCDLLEEEVEQAVAAMKEHSAEFRGKFDHYPGCSVCSYLSNRAKK